MSMKKGNGAKRLSGGQLVLLALLAVILLISSGCDIQILFVNQPSTIPQGGTVTYDVTVDVSMPPGEEETNNQFFAVMIPNWFDVTGLMLLGGSTVAYNSTIS